MYAPGIHIGCWHRYVGYRHRHEKAYRIVRNKLCSDVGIRRDDARRVSPHSVLDLVVILPLLHGACSTPSPLSARISTASYIRGFLPGGRGRGSLWGS